MREILTSFLKIGATAYGGPAIMGVMQAEFQERRQWLTKPQFLEALAFVNMLPGATATQLGIFPRLSTCRLVGRSARRCRLLRSGIRYHACAHAGVFRARRQPYAAQRAVRPKAK